MMETKSKIPQSHIPIKTARPVQSALPSSLSTLHLGLVPPSRHLSVSDSPSHPSPGSSPSVSSTGGGLTSFRSFRNLLPFGPGKHHSPSTSPASPSKGSFGGLGSIRRSIHGERVGERSVSAPQLRPARSQEDQPILTIELSHKVNEPLINQEELQNGLGLYEKHLGIRYQRFTPPASQFSEESVNSSAINPLGPSDLSTILESETSGISKHIPLLDDSQDNHNTQYHPEPENGNALTPHDSHPNQSPRFYHPDKPESRHGWRTPASQDTSALDLSTSKVSNEVLQALAENERQEGWLHGIVIDDAADSPTEIPISATATEVTQEPNASFNLGALDPDLAALLSPNRLKAAEPALLGAIDALSPPPLTPPLTDSRCASPPPSPQNLANDNTYRPSSLSSAAPSPVMTARSVASQSSPIRRSTSLSRSASSKFASSSSVPRLARSVSERPPHTQSPLPSPMTYTLSARASDVGERHTSPGAVSSQRKRYSQISPDGPPVRRPGTGDSESRQSAASRLATPGRPPLHLTPPSTSRIAPIVPRHVSNTASPSWDTDSISPSSRAPSSMGTASSRFQYGRPSLDGTADRFRGTHIRQRDRSASFTESPPGRYQTSSGSRPPTTEWLGPRTVKAFAAAGLLDLDKEGNTPSASRPGSRFSTARSHSDRDFRSQYAPSRMAFSEAGSGSTSWGRRSGSISNTGAMSEIGSPFSESVSTPRTTFSTGSTAPTSISASSSMQQLLQSEIQMMQEKHALETGALLNALADSQRTTRILRDENTQLRDRIQDLENRLADALDQLQRMQYSSSLHTMSSLARSGYQRMVGPRSTEIPRRRTPQPPSGLQALIHPDEEYDDDEDSPELKSPPDPARLSSDSRADTDSKAHRRRFSNSSSIFPVPPSTMSMLLHEEGMAPETAFSTHSTQSQGSQNGHYRSSSSNMGNISPTTANFSMITGSPGSLNLRPEHERLLGDMPTLDLCSEDYEPHATDDDGG